jgi:two-component system, NtrC family, sensor kinase
MEPKSRRARKSLRSLLMMWLIMFSVVPLAFITGYSLVKYEQAIDQELAQRLNGNRREIEAILEEYKGEMANKSRRHAEDNALVVFLTSRNIPQVRERAAQLMKSHITSQTQVFDREGLVLASLYKDDNGEIHRREGEELKVELTGGFLKQLNDKDQIFAADIVSEKKIDLISFAKVKAPNGTLVGYIEEFVSLDIAALNNLKHRLNIDLVVFNEVADKSKRRAIGTHNDLRELELKQNFFTRLYHSAGGELAELQIQSIPYGFIVQPLAWGESNLYLAIGASKQAVKSVLNNVNYAFFTVVGAIIFLLVVLSLLMSRVLLKPVNDLLEAIDKVDPEGGIPNVPSTSDNELGVLIGAFNEMSERVHATQKALKDKVTDLESANLEIRDTQAKLVHAAKMASLGQLVAGIAHELNNPISFIYSNMAHLRDYASRLTHLVEVAERDPAALTTEKQNVEFDYVVNDMPKLIKSCEEGARRTRDIVLGLRNFSRLEEAKIKEVDLHEGIESTLALLSGEMSSRIRVIKNFGALPKVLCYPSQLNQVFMNILSNAIHAIRDTGEIIITTTLAGPNRVEISIKDTGVGMSADVQEKIFDPFFTTKGVSHGTGLGMSITYGIVQKHGGDIFVHSQPNKGTEFVISIPVRGT